MWGNTRIHAGFRSKDLAILIVQDQKQLVTMARGQEQSRPFEAAEGSVPFVEVRITAASLMSILVGDDIPRWRSGGAT